MNDTLAVVVIGVLVFLIWQSRQAAAAGGGTGAPDPRLADGSKPSTLTNQINQVATGACQVGVAAAGAGYVAPFCKYNAVSTILNHRGEIVAVTKGALTGAATGVEIAAKQTLQAGSTAASWTVKPIVSGVSSGVKAATSAVASVGHAVLGWL